MIKDGTFATTLSLEDTSDTRDQLLPTEGQSEPQLQVTELNKTLLRSLRTEEDP